MEKWSDFDGNTMIGQAIWYLSSRNMRHSRRTRFSMFQRPVDMHSILAILTIPRVSAYREPFVIRLCVAAGYKSMVLMVRLADRPKRLLPSVHDAGGT
jgi:hypothetical protein